MKHQAIGTMIMLALSTCMNEGCQSSEAQPREKMIKRTELQRHDLSIPGRESIQAKIDFEPGAAFGRHYHPGEEVIYVLEGSFEYTVEGMAPVTLRAGDVLFIPSGTIHAARNVGTDNAVELATYIVDKDTELVIMVEKEDSSHHKNVNH